MCGVPMHVGNDLNGRHEDIRSYAMIRPIPALRLIDWVQACFPYPGARYFPCLCGIDLEWKRRYVLAWVVSDESMR